MGASAGTGVRSFAEGGSTSAPSGNSFNLATVNQNYARALADPSSVTLDTSRPGLGTPPRQIYQPQYEDYGLGSTPQAQGQLAALLNMGSYGNQMPTFTRPQAAPQMSYRTPIPTGMGTKDPNLAIIDQTLRSPAYMDLAQRNTILENPGAYLEYAKYKQGGGDPAQFSRNFQPIRYMTQAQREALMEKQRLELSRLLPPARPDDNSYG
jgi:hypothetical protein